MYQIKVVSQSVVRDWVYYLARTKRFDNHVGLLLSGDRLSVCDEAVVARTEEILGACTIAPKGEVGEGPAIVGLYVVPHFRRRGISAALLEATTRRCIERGFRSVRVDVMSAHAMKIIGSLDPSLIAAMDVNYQGNFMDLF